MNKKQQITDLIYAYKWENQPLEETVDKIDNIYTSLLPSGDVTTDLGNSVPGNTDVSYGNVFIGSDILKHICPNNSWQLQFWGGLYKMMTGWLTSYAHSKVDFHRKIPFNDVEIGKPYVYRVMMLGQENDEYVMPYCLDHKKNEYRCIGFTHPSHKQPHYGFCVDERYIKACDLQQPNHSLYKFL